MPENVRGMLELTERIATALQDGPMSRMEVLDRTTALLLMLGYVRRSLDRGLLIVDPEAVPRARRDLDAAESDLRRIEAVAQTAPDCELAQMLGDASERSAAIGRRLLQNQ